MTIIIIIIIIIVNLKSKCEIYVAKRISLKWLNVGESRESPLDAMSLHTG